MVEVTCGFLVVFIFSLLCPKSCDLGDFDNCDDGCHISREQVLVGIIVAAVMPEWGQGWNLEQYCCHRQQRDTSKHSLLLEINNSNRQTTLVLRGRDDWATSFVTGGRKQQAVTY